MKMQGGPPGAILVEYIVLAFSSLDNRRLIVTGSDGFYCINI
jgi:hypothetical protein